jgi:hypothetical protein
MNRSLNRCIAAFMLAACFSISAKADDGKAPAGTCAGLLQKLCGDPKSPDFRDCAMQHQADIAACYSKGMGATGAVPQRKKSACAEDAKKYCPGKWPGTDEFASCMRSNESKVSKACLDEYNSQKSAIAKRKKDMEPCIADAKKLCPGMGPYDEKLTRCMMEHMDQLSPACRDAQSKARKGAGTGDLKSDAACAKAINQLCPDATPGSAEYSQCIGLHFKELPSDCKHRRK